MAEHEDWTAADDAVVRRAMATLRADVELVPLADVRFVRARGRARRRQRLLTWGAAAAAAVVVAGVAGYAALGTNRTPAPLPPQTSPTSRPTTTAPAYAALPTLADWRKDLGIQADRLVKVDTLPTVLCGGQLPSGFVEGYSVGGDAKRPSGFALQFRPTGTTGTQAATAFAESVEKCRAPYTVLPHYRDPYGAAWLTSDRGSGYVGTASTTQALTVLLYTDPTLKGDPLKAGFGDLLNTAQARLEAAGASGATSSSDQPGALPLLSEWKQALGLTGTARLTPVKPFGPVECLSSEPGTKVQQEQVTVEGTQFEGGQVRFAIGAGQDVATAAEGVATDIAGCQAGPGFTVTRVETNGFPKLFSYTAGDAGSGWFAVVVGPRDVGVLQVVDPSHATSVYTRAQVAELAKTAMERLKRYGTGSSGSGTSTTTAPPFSGPKAVDEQMPVVGPAPVPSSTLFVAASQWTSTSLTGGAKAYAGPGALEGSTAITACETDQQQAGIGGQVGIVSVRAGSGSANYIGKQRVQVDESADPATQQGYVKARLADASTLYAKGCSFANGKVKATPGPTQGTWRLDTVFSDGSPTRSEWVAVTAQRTPGAVSTIVITKMADPKQGFAELDRLVNLARQK